MKSLFSLAAASALLAGPAFAETKVPMDQFIDALVKNPAAALNAEEKTTKDPVTFSMVVGKDTLETDADLAAFFAAARAKLPVKTYTTPSGATLTADYGRLRVKGAETGLAVFDYENDIKENQAAPGDLDGTQQGSYDNTQYKVISIVGNIVSFSEIGDSYGAGAAHPNSTDSIHAYDTGVVTKEGEYLSYPQANLSQLVDENGLVAAIKADKFLNSKLSPKYRKLLAGARTLQEVGDVANGGLTSGSTCYDLGVYDGKISNFAFYDYDPVKDLVSVRITMEASAHVCAGAAPTKQLGVLVKPRDDLRFNLRAMTNDHTGLLGKDAAH